MKTKKNSSARLSTDRPGYEPGRDEIAALAYSIWERKGRAQGHDVEYWLHAEAQLRQARQQVSVRR